MRLYEITEGWSEKYKKSINCSNPKGFSQKAHCAGKKKKVKEYGVPDYTTMPTYKLKKASKGKQKFFLPSNEPTPKGVQAVEDVVDFPGTYVKKEYVTINGVKMLRDVWDYMTHDREEEHGFDDKANRVHKGLSNFTGKEDPEVLKKAYQMELRNFIDEFENQDMDPQPFIDELDRLEEDIKKLSPGHKLDKLPHDEVESAIHRWVSQDDHIELSNGMHILSGENHGYADNVALIVDKDYKILDHDDNIVDLMQQFTAQEIDPSIVENFADGKKKGKSRPGRVKRSGASCKGSVTSLRAKAKKYSGERGKMYHWCANMKSGKKKSK